MYDLADTILLFLFNYNPKSRDVFIEYRSAILIWYKAGKKITSIPSPLRSVFNRTHSAAPVWNKTCRKCNRKSKGGVEWHVKGETEE